ncbi:MAG: glycosyltransferase family 2 protein [Erythrobacter sp.]
MPLKQSRNLSSSSDKDLGHSVDISILIVAYNSRDCIEECLTAIRSAAHSVRTEIILVDNGEDGTGDIVGANFPEVVIVQSEGNVGFAKANNRLAKIAIGANLLLLNPDAFLQVGAVEELHHAAKKYADAGAWGGVTVDRNGAPDLGNTVPVPSLGELLSSATGKAKSGKQTPTSINEDQFAEVLPGGMMMVPRSVWNEFGGFDERFFLYCEEVDLCVRLRKAGLKLHRIAKAKAYHNAAHGNFQSPLRRLYQIAGMVEYLRKHWSIPKCILGIGLIWVGAFWRYAIGTVAGRFNPALAVIGKRYRMIALRPNLWIFGYHNERGLKAQLDRKMPQFR